MKNVTLIVVLAAMGGVAFYVYKTRIPGQQQSPTGATQVTANTKTGGTEAPNVIVEASKALSAIFNAVGAITQSTSRTT